MIRTEDEYRVGLRRLEESKNAIAQTHAVLQQQGIDAATIDMLLESMRALQRDVQDEVVAYERARDFDFDQVPFAGLGRLLISLRIARRMSVSALAEALGVDKGNVSRDEKNDYRSITRDRIERVLAALNVELMITPVPKEVAVVGAQAAAAPYGQIGAVSTSAAGTRVVHTGYVPEQPVAWPVENVQWHTPSGLLSGYVQAVSGEVGLWAQPQTPASPQPAHVNVVSSRVRAEAA